MRSRPALERCGRAGAAALALLLLAGCGTVKSPTEPEETEDGAAFTFSRVQAEIFTPNCALAGCHDAATATEGLILEAGRSYGLIVNHSATQSSLDRIEPGDPERSYLIKKLRGDPDITGSRMPFDRPGSLPPEQMAGIIGWVRAGAPP
ncbi:MAG TPA: hypothetical protein VF756_10250 [Thermoanaerobaculia bacterium]